MVCYTVLLLVLCAYWCQFLPGHMVGPADRLLFGSGSRRSGSRGRRVVDETALVIVDQQLITGLAILIAGYIQAVTSDLAVYHWNVVVYLAWLSATVHPMSLSLLRDRPSENPTLRTIRLAAMLLLFGLLAAALIPTTSARWSLALKGLPGEVYLRPYPAGASSTRRQGTPMRCFWFRSDPPGDTYFSPWNGYYGRNSEAILSYVSLVCVYAWRLSQFFDTSRSWMHLWGRAKPESALETAARRVLRSQPFGWWAWLKYRLLVQVYVLFVACAVFVGSFMTTVLTLGFILLWGTSQLYWLGPRVPGDVEAAQRQMGFGQILPLVLLLQPVLVAVTFSTGKKVARFGDPIHNYLPACC